MEEENKGGITRESIEEAMRVIYESTPVEQPRTIKFYNRGRLDVHEGEGQLGFEIGGIMTGLHGFINLKNNHIILNEGESAKERFTDIFYNGNQLSEKGTEYFWDKLEEYESNMDHSISGQN